MFFNLIEAAEHGVRAGTDLSSNPHSEILFEETPIDEDGDELCVFCHVHLLAHAHPTQNMFSSCRVSGSSTTLELRSKLGTGQEVQARLQGGHLN